jgi:hypothetical protein
MSITEKIKRAPYLSFLIADTEYIDFNSFFKGKIDLKSQIFGL